MTEPELPPRVRDLFVAARNERPSADLAARVVTRAREPERRPTAVYVLWIAAPFAAAALLAVWFVQPAAPVFVRHAETELTPHRPHTNTAQEDQGALPLPSAAVHARELDVVDGERASPTVVKGASAVVASTSAKASSPSPNVEPFTLQRELELLGQTKAALAANDAKTALRVLSRYQSLSATRGQLRAEAEVLRLEALSQNGQSEMAASEARKFLERRPTSPLVDKAKRFLGVPHEQINEPSADTH